MSKYLGSYTRALSEHPEEVAELVQAIERALWTSKYLLGEDGICPAARDDVLSKLNALRAAIGAGPWGPD